VFLPKSAAIAEEHRTIASHIALVDELIYAIGDFPIRVDQMCDNVGIQPIQFQRILMLYVAAGVLRKDRRRYCSQCESLIEDDGDEECDNCEATFKKQQPDVFDVFIPVDPVMRVDPEADSDGEEEIAIRIQFVAGDRGGGQRNQLQTPKEHRAIRDAIQSATYRDYFPALDAIHAASLEQLGALYTVNATVIHFGGHGDDRSLSFVLDQELLAQTVPVTADQLVAILREFPQRIRLCVFNTCNSAQIALDIVAAGAVDFAIGWRGRVPDAVAISFAEQLYRHIANGLSLGQAFALAEACSPTGNVSVSAVLAVADGLNARNYSPLKP
jgi:hypothetical protein